MKVEINAVPMSALDDMQEVLRILADPKKINSLSRKGAFAIRKDFIKGIQVAINLIDFYKKGEAGWTNFLKDLGL